MKIIEFPTFLSRLKLSRRNFIRNSALTVAGFSFLQTKSFAAFAAQSGLADLYKNDFLIGTAIGSRTLMQPDTEMLDLIARGFNQVTSENAMKKGCYSPKGRRLEI
jgi:endo-1,4-beta-xylanase